MRLGFVFPQYEIEHDPAAIKDLAQAAEGLGYRYVMPYEHVLGANPDRPGGWHGPYTFEHGFHEPFVLFGYLAGITQLEFLTGILILPQRQTVLVAKQAAEVDILSNGRLRMGFGVGWNKVEYDALGHDFSQRGKRIEEQVQLLRALWTQPLVTFNGEFDHVEDAGINPLPVQRPIPLWFGGGADVVLDRMARLGDGWVPNAMTPEQTHELVERLTSYLEKYKRPKNSFGIDVRLDMRRLERHQWTDYIEMWRGLGATHFCINTLGIGAKTARDHIRLLKQAREEINL